MGEVVLLPGVTFAEPSPQPGPNLRIDIFAGYEIVRENLDGTEDVVERVFEGPDGVAYTSSKRAREDGRRQLNWFRKHPEDIKEEEELVGDSTGSENTWRT
jgi:hypothetical protein